MGDWRKETGRKTQSAGVSNIYYSALGGMDEDIIDAGNLTECQTPAVLRKINSESRKAENLHREGLIDIIVTQQVLADVDSERNTVPGYIQFCR